MDKEKAKKLGEGQAEGKLSLKRETVRTLSNGELQAAAGGIWGIRWSTAACKVYDTIFCW